MTQKILQTSLTALGHADDLTGGLVLGRSLLALDGMLDLAPPSGEEVTANSHIAVLLRTIGRWLTASQNALRSADPATRDAIAFLANAVRASDGPHLVDPASGGVDDTSMADLTALRAEGATRADALVEATGPTLSADEVAARIGITRQAVNKRRQEGRLLAVPVGRSQRYPAWQFTQSGEVLIALEQVLARLDLPPLMALQWFHSPVEEDGPTPIDLLRSGRSALVEQLASQAGEQGAT